MRQDGMAAKERRKTEAAEHATKEATKEAALLAKAGSFSGGETPSQERKRKEQEVKDTREAMMAAKLDAM